MGLCSHFDEKLIVSVIILAVRSEHNANLRMVVGSLHYKVRTRRRAHPNNETTCDEQHTEK